MTLLAVKFLRRLFLKMMIFSPRWCSTSSAATIAPEISGAPIPGAIAGNHQNIGEFDGIAGLSGNLLDIENIFRGNPVLFAAIE